MEEDEDKDTNKVSGVLVGARVCLLCVCVCVSMLACCLPFLNVCRRVSCVVCACLFT